METCKEEQIIVSERLKDKAGVETAVLGTGMLQVGRWVGLGCFFFWR